MIVWDLFCFFINNILCFIIILNYYIFSQRDLIYLHYHYVPVVGYEEKTYILRIHSNLWSIVMKSIITARYQWMNSQKS